MRVFTILGIVFTVIGVGLVALAVMPNSGGIEGEATGMGAGIAAITLLPMGIIFTIIGVGYSRATGGRRRLLEMGIPGQATVLSVSGGNVVVNNINVLLTFRMRVMMPGRAPYEVDHRQLTSMFQMAALQVGATVPVMIDPADPSKLTIDLAGEGRASAARAARPVTGAYDAGVAAATVVPNTLTTMSGVAPNKIDAFPPSGSYPPAGAYTAAGSYPGTAGYPGAGGFPPTAGSQPTPGYPVAGVYPVPGIDPATMAAVTGQLARLGISIDPSMLAGGQMTMDSATLDLRPGAHESVLATGRPGTAVIRSMTDTGVNVRGESLVRLTLDVTPEGGTTYQAQTGDLIPDADRVRAVPGATVRVRIDPAQPATVAIDWAAHP